MPDNTPNPVAVQPDGSAAEPARQSPQDRLKEITAGIEQGIKDLFIITINCNFSAFSGEIRKNHWSSLWLRLPPLRWQLTLYYLTFIKYLLT